MCDFQFIMFRLKVLPVFQIFCIVKCFEIDISKTFYTGFLESGTEVILYVHGDINPFPSNVNKYLIQQIIVSSDYDTPMKYNFLRYMTPFNILILPYVQTYSQATGNVFRSMKNLIYATDTLIIYINASLFQQPWHVAKYNINRTDANKTKTEPVFQTSVKIVNAPSFKLVLNYSQFGDLTNAWTICNGYCSETPHKIVNFENILFHQKGIIQLHKRYFWSANNKKVPAWLADTYESTFFPESIHKQFSCDIAYKTRKYKNLIDHRFCWAKQMLASELSKIHNITFIKWTSVEDYTFYSQYAKNGFKDIWHEGLHLQYYSGSSYHYCLDTKLRNTTALLGYDTWIKPICNKTWILALCTWFSVAFFYTLKEKVSTILELLCKFTNNLLRSFYLLTCSGISISCKGSLITILVISSWFYWNLYGNNIIGLTIVEDKVEPFETVAEFLDAGFRDSKNKSLATQCQYLRTPTVYPDCTDGQKRTLYYFVKEKLGFMQQARWNFWYKFEFQVKFTKLYGPSLKCLYVKEQKNIFPWFMIISTNNRYWMMKTIKRIHEGGFMPAWNKWAFHLEHYSNQIYFQDEEIPDSIQTKQLWSIVLLCLSIIGISHTIFGLEIINNFLKLSKNVKSFKVMKIKRRLKTCVIDLGLKVIEMIQMLCSKFRKDIVIKYLNSE